MVEGKMVWKSATSLAGEYPRLLCDRMARALLKGLGVGADRATPAWVATWEGELTQLMAAHASPVGRSCTPRRRVRFDDCGPDRAAGDEARRGRRYFERRDALFGWAPEEDVNRLQTAGLAAAAPVRKCATC